MDFTVKIGLVIIQLVVLALSPVTSLPSPLPPLRGPPQFETHPQYLDSYIPAAMQLIAYLTELMKYDIQPIVSTTTPPMTMRPPHGVPGLVTTSTRRPPPMSITTAWPAFAGTTQAHAPGLYAPYKPPSYVGRSDVMVKEEGDGGLDDGGELNDAVVETDGYKEYLKRLRNPTGTNYFDRYHNPDPDAQQLLRTKRAVPFNFNNKSVSGAPPKQPISTQTRSAFATSGSATAAGTASGRHQRAVPFSYSPSNNSADRRRHVNTTFVSLHPRRPVRQTTRQEAKVGGRLDVLDEDVAAVDGGSKTTIIETAAAIHVHDNIDDVTDNKSTSREKKSRQEDDAERAAVESYLGFGFSELVRTIGEEDGLSGNRLESDEDRVRLFSGKYDDSRFGAYVIKQKKVPPTKAYVTLLSLYDLLNKESKKLGLNKYNGYSTGVIEELVESSTGTSARQLRTVLHRVVERGDTRDDALLRKIRALVTDLDQTASYINDALRYIPPLPFAH